MANPVTQLQRALKENHFVLIRQDRHYIYKNHENKIFVTPATPSDTRWARNAISDLKRVLNSPPKPMGAQQAQKGQKRGVGGTASGAANGASSRLSFEKYPTCRKECAAGGFRNER